MHAEEEARAIRAEGRGDTVVVPALDVAGRLPEAPLPAEAAAALPAAEESAAVRRGLRVGLPRMRCMRERDGAQRAHLGAHRRDERAEIERRGPRTVAICGCGSDVMVDADQLGMF